MLSIHLLGLPRIQRDGEPIHIIRRKSRALEAGGWLVGDEVTIDLEVELIKQEEAVAVPA